MRWVEMHDWPAWLSQPAGHSPPPIVQVVGTTCASDGDPPEPTAPPLLAAPPPFEPPDPLARPPEPIALPEPFVPPEPLAPPPVCPPPPDDPPAPSAPPVDGVELSGVAVPVSLL